MPLHLGSFACQLVLSLAPFAVADEPALDRTPAPIATTAEDTIRTAPRATLVLAGYAEVLYQWNFNDPANGITNFRGFDNRHNTFTLANAVLDATGAAGPVSARVALQIGHTPETYYLAEPNSPGTSGAGSTSASVWKFLQQANVGYRAPVGRGLLIEGGIFLSPIGPEGMAIKDQWNWSRSNLFFGLPFYHTGLKLSYPLNDRLTLIAMACNGWNSVVDNNAGKSIAVEALYIITDKLVSHILYFTGVERPTGAPEGSPWRHLLDAYVTWYPSSRLALNLHGDAGFERNNFGTSSWGAGALSLRVQTLPWLHLAARGDLFYEGVAENAQGRASAIFWPSQWVTSQTLTADVRTQDNVSFRLEYRHDHADDPMFFRGSVATDGTGAFVMNATSQNTLTAGMVVWF
jgi:hypothetical protein